MKEITIKEQIQVFFRACFYGLIWGCFGGCIGLIAWSYELQEYIINYTTAFNSACLFGLAGFCCTISFAIFPEKEQEKEYIPGFFDRKKDGNK